MRYLFLFLLLSFCACGQRSETTTFQIKAMESSNQSTPFYVLFKATDLAHFLTDDYKKIAHQRMLAGEDPDCLDSVFFVPGETKTITLEDPKNKTIGVYFIFTHPGEEWKYLVQDGGNKKIKILVGENEIRNVNSF